MTNLAELTTLRVGGPAGEFVEVDYRGRVHRRHSHGRRRGHAAARDRRRLQPARSATRASTGSCFATRAPDIIGPGRRLLRRRLRHRHRRAPRGTTLVARAVADELGWPRGAERDPGLDGSGAGAEHRRIRRASSRDTLASVRVWDRERVAVRTLTLIELGFGYRTSILKRSLAAPYGPTPRYVVLRRHRADAVRHAVGADALPAARRRARGRGGGDGADRRRCARRCSRCARPREWCSTPRTTTRGAPARSSPIPVVTRRRGAGRRSRATQRRA